LRSMLGGRWGGLGVGREWGRVEEKRVEIVEDSGHRPFLC